MENVTVTCPECGKSFEVSASMVKITCNFCGKVFAVSMKSVSPKSVSPINDGQLNSEKSEISSGLYFDKAIAALPDRKLAALNLSEAITKLRYQQSFNDYYDEICESFEYFGKAYSLYSGEKKELVLKYAEAFAARIKKNAGKENFNLLKGIEQENVIYLYVFFAIPSVLKFEAEYSDALADALLQTWNCEHKKRKIGKSTYEAINQGFKTKLCFITTAVCNTLGLADNCYELQSFRKFRDDYLLKQPGGKEQVQEYYLIAPQIVNAIDASADRDLVYHNIWGDYLSKCLKMYENHDYELCRKAYAEMVSILRNKWL